MEKTRTAIVVVAYNTAQLIKPQVECIRKFCTDNPDIIVIDNSSDLQAADGVRHHAGILGCEYLKTNATSINSSDSHSFAANLSYQKLRDSYEYFAYLDQDLFPVKEFSVAGILGDKIMGGIGQQKGDKKYFWQGALLFNNTLVDKDLIDFSPNSEFRLDTGGNLFRMIEKFGEDRFVFFNEIYEQNPGFTKSFYNFYSMIYDKHFMHFIASSNWNYKEHHEERINSLLNILYEKTGL